MADESSSFETNMTATLGEDGTIALSGDWDSEAVKASLYQPLIETVLGIDPEGVIVLDVSQLEFIDSTGLRSLLHLQRQFGQERGKPLRLRHPSIGVERLLNITGTADLFEIIEPEAE